MKPNKMYFFNDNFIDFQYYFIFNEDKYWWKWKVNDSIWKVVPNNYWTRSNSKISPIENNITIDI
jgi:hypothetical protein